MPLSFRTQRASLPALRRRRTGSAPIDVIPTGGIKAKWHTAGIHLRWGVVRVIAPVIVVGADAAPDGGGVHCVKKKRRCTVCANARPRPTLGCKGILCGHVFLCVVDFFSHLVLFLTLSYKGPWAS